MSDWFDTDGPASDRADRLSAGYLVLHEGTVIEHIDAVTADEALAQRQMLHGDLYVKVVL